MSAFLTLIAGTVTNMSVSSAVDIFIWDPAMSGCLWTRLA